MVGPPAPEPGYFVGRVGDLGLAVDMAGTDPVLRRAAPALGAYARPLAPAIVSVVNLGERPRRMPVLVATTADGREVPLVDARTLLLRLPPAARGGRRLPPATPVRVGAGGSVVAYLAAVDVAPAAVESVRATGGGTGRTLRREQSRPPAR